MIAVVDSGVGNLRSVVKALAAVGADVTLTADSQTILSAQKVVLPGVGAFADTMDGLRDRNLIPIIREIRHRQIPLLGICVGMQVMFDASEEMGHHEGLGFLPGMVRRFNGENTKAARKICPTSIWKVAARKLDQVDSVTTLAELRIPPNNKLEALSGDRKGQHSIRINDQYRICFVWTESGPDQVEIVDYH